MDGSWRRDRGRYELAVLEELEVELEHDAQQMQVGAMIAADIVRPHVDDHDLREREREEARLALKVLLLLAALSTVGTLDVEDQNVLGVAVREVDALGALATMTHVHHHERRAEQQVQQCTYTHTHTRTQMAQISSALDHVVISREASITYSCRPTALRGSPAYGSPIPRPRDPIVASPHPRDPCTRIARYHNQPRQHPRSSLTTIITIAIATIDVRVLAIIVDHMHRRCSLPSFQSRHPIL